jgi:flagellar secretion chaperone FliS
MTNLTATPQAYRENMVLSATPARLVVMLYDGAQRFLRQAATAMRAGEVEHAHNTLRRAESIVAHLDGVLDDDQEPQFSARLHAIYRFCLVHLDRARIGQDADKLEEVGRLLAELRESWAEIANE